MNWTAAATATFPSLLGIAASRLGEHLRQSGLDLTKDLEKLPPNLKDLLRKLVIKSGAKCCNLYLPVLVHEKVATLDLSDLDIDSVSWLQKCPNLKKLNLKQCLRKDTPAEAELAQVLAKLPLLEALHLQYNGTVVSDSVLNEIGEKCSRLRTLDLGRCAAITDRGLESLRNLKHLKSLNLGHTNITDDGIEKLFANNHCWKQSLCELKLDNCVNITDYGIEVVLETCQEKLNIFIIHACPRTTDRSVMAIESFLNSRGQKVEQVTWTFY